MENDPQKQEQPSSKKGSDPDEHDYRETPKQEEDIDITSLLEKMQKDIAKVSDNTTSEKNQSVLDRLEKTVDKLLGFVEKIVPGQKQEEGTPPAPPETPDVNVPGMKWIAVRKRGGRVVKRAVPTEEKPQA